MLCDVQTGDSSKVFLDRGSGFQREMTLSPDGLTVAAGSSNCTILPLDVKTGDCCNIFRNDSLIETEEEVFPEEIWSLVFSPDGQIIASVCDDYAIRLWDFKTGKCRRILEIHSVLEIEQRWPGEVNMLLAFSPDGQTLASSADDSNIQLWSIQTGACLSTLKGRSGKDLQNNFLTGWTYDSISVRRFYSAAVGYTDKESF